MRLYKYSNPWMGEQAHRRTMMRTTPKVTAKRHTTDEKPFGPSLYSTFQGLFLFNCLILLFSFYSKSKVFPAPSQETLLWTGWVGSCVEQFGNLISSHGTQSSRLFWKGWLKPRVWPKMQKPENKAASQPFWFLYRITNFSGCWTQKTTSLAADCSGFVWEFYLGQTQS